MPTALFSGTSQENELSTEMPKKRNLTYIGREHRCDDYRPVIGTVSRHFVIPTHPGPTASAARTHPARPCPDTRRALTTSRFHPNT